MVLYILQNDESKKYYVGCTEDIAQRVKEHNVKRKRKWTGRQPGEWRLVYERTFDNKCDALIEERRIKRQKNHKHIERLIENWNRREGSSISLVSPMFRIGVPIVLNKNIKENRESPRANVIV